MLPTKPSKPTQGSTGYATPCTSTVSSVASPPQARSSVACAARATPTTRTGPPGEPPGSATRPSPSAATAEQLVRGFGYCHCRTCPKQNKNSGRVWLHFQILLLVLSALELMLEVNYGAYVMNYLQFGCVIITQMVSDRKLCAGVD